LRILEQCYFAISETHPDSIIRPNIYLITSPAGSGIFVAVLAVTQTDVGLLPGIRAMPLK